MANLNTFRAVNDVEKKILFSSIENISVDLSHFLQENPNKIYVLIVSSREKFEYPKVYFVPKRLINVIRKISINSVIRAGGVYLGFIKRGKFNISLEAIEYFFSRNALFFSNLQKLKLTTEGEKAFLYGNDIRKNMVLDLSPYLIKHSFLLVFNSIDEFLGIALLRENLGSIEYIKPSEIIALHLQDKGYYLRKEQ
jgi:ribosome biogenesis protein Nip4